jgi:CHAD domain-containing protein
VSYRLKRSESAADGIRRVVIERLDDAIEQLRERLHEDQTAAVHSARKDLKKARSVVRLVRSELGEKRYREENDRLRDAGRGLSDARDAAVRAQVLDDLREQFGDDLSPQATKALTDAIAATSIGKASGRSLEGVATEARAEIERARDSAANWQFGAGGWQLIGDGLDRAYRRGRKKLAEVGAHPSDEAVHAWRKRVKDLWYQLRLLRKSRPEAVGELVDQADELADLLGDHHDLSLLAADLEGTELTLAADEQEALAELIARRQAELLDAAIALGGRLYAEKPKAFSRRMHGYWRAWRD